MGHYILAGDGSLVLERRAVPRYEVSLGVQIGVWDGETSLQGVMTNISQTGAQVVIQSMLEENAVLKFECRAFGGIAEVMWTRREGDQIAAGLKFVSLSQKDQIALRNLISTLTKQQETLPETVPARVVPAA